MSVARKLELAAQGYQAACEEALAELGRLTYRVEQAEELAERRLRHIDAYRRTIIGIEISVIRDNDHSYLIEEAKAARALLTQPTTPAKGGGETP